MNKHSIFIIIALTVVWVVLAESYSLQTIITGAVVGAVCSYFCNRSLHLEEALNVRFVKLAGYPFYLVWQIYLAGFYVVRQMIKGAQAEIVEVTTELQSEYLRLLLAHSATLTPGSIALDLTDNRITALWLRGKDDKQKDAASVGYAIKGPLEEWLIKAEEREV